MIKEDMVKQGNFLFRHRSVLPFLLVPFAWHYLVMLGNDAYFMRWEDAYLLTCLAVSLLGLGLRVYTVGHVPKDTSGRNTVQQKASVLNTTGMYSIVRHPLYLANYIVFAGFLMAFQNLLLLFAGTALYFFYYERIAAAEENFLMNKFGDDYHAWAKDVPAFFPNLFLWRKPELPMSWRKIFRKEGPGFLLICFYFFAFEAAHDMLVERKTLPHWIHEDVLWEIVLVIGIAVYSVLKFLRKKTDWLLPSGQH